MSKVASYKPGMLCWTEMGTTDAAAAKEFYSRIFRWQVHEAPVDSDEPYYLFHIENDQVAGLYAYNADQREQGIPPNWLCYFSVADVNETTEKARSLGANILTGPFDVMELGRMSLIQDPTGATFGIWEAKAHIGTMRLGEHGTITWAELTTNDVDKALAFYTELFGYGTTRMESQEGLYIVFDVNGSPAAGLASVQATGQNTPAYWQIYFNVDDSDMLVEEVRKAGGTVLTEPTDIPDVGRFAILRDPTGGVFSVLQPNPVMQQSAAG